MINVIGISIGAMKRSLSIVKDNLVLWLRNLSSEDVNSREADYSGSGNTAECYSARGVAHSGATEINWGDIALSGAWTLTAHYYLAPANSGSIMFTSSGSLNTYIRPYNATNGMRIRANGGSQDYFGSEDYTGHVFMTLSSDGTTVKVYKNGVYDDETTYNATFTFGETHNGSTFDIFSLTIHSRQLSDSEILAMYENPETPPSGTNLELWLPLDEGNSTVAYDGSGNTRDGTITGGSWLTTIGGIHPQTAKRSFNVRDVVVSTPVMLPEGLTEGEDMLGTTLTTITDTGAYRFVGDGYILIPDDASMDSSNSFSLWVNADSTTEEIWEIINSSTDIAASSGTISATGFTSPTIYVDDSVSSTLPAGSWKMITVKTSTPINVGAMKVGMVGSTGFNGQIKFPKVYTDELTADEVTQNFNVAQ